MYACRYLLRYSMCLYLQEMRNTVQTFATSLLDHVRTSYELEIMLNHNPKGDPWEPGERLTLERLKLAIKYKQKAVILLTGN